MGKYFPKTIVVQPVSVQMLLIEAVEDIDDRLNKLEQQMNQLTKEKA